MDWEPVFTDKESQLIADEFERLGSLVYLDHTGSCLYPKSLIEAVSRDLCTNTYSNPHSSSTCSRATSDSIDQVRFRVLQHFNTDQNEYSVIFTSGATAALKLVAEAFNWSSLERQNNTEWLPAESQSNIEIEKGDFVYINDSHTSVLGMRTLVEERGSSVTCLTVDEAFKAFKNHSEAQENLSHSSTNSLFVYPAQCNYSGLKYPLEWIEKTHKGSLDTLFNTKKSNWYCLLDAATLLSSSPLNLSTHKPDYVCLSFYKMFGYPTGLGALLVKNSSADVLLKKYYGGGTVQIALSSKNAFVPRPLVHDKYEDGTLNFLSILSLHHCFNILYKLVGSMDRVSRHCYLLAKYTFESLIKLHHSNGSPAVELYTDTCYDDESVQGGVINFNLLRSNGEFVGFVEVLHLANLHNIQLRTGCFCNSGACWRHLNLSSDQIKSQYKAGHVCGDDMDLVDGRPTGSIRISFGYYTNLSNVDYFLNMIETCFVEQPSIKKMPDCWSEQSLEMKERFKSCSTVINGLSNHTRITNSSDSKTVNGRIIIANQNVAKHKDAVEITEGQVLLNIFVYPVKSCGALAVSSWCLDSKGLEYDRVWMIVTSSGVALTQKREPKMCLVKPKIDFEDRKLILTYEDKYVYRKCSVPLDVDEELKEWGGSLCQSKVCGDRIEGLDCGDFVGSWLSEALGISGLRLIRQRSRTSKTPALSLANQAQYLLVSKTSVMWLSDQITSSEFNKDTMIDRFRSNFVLENITEPFVEQNWTKVNIGDSEFMVNGGCNRCHMICIDQMTGSTSKEPLNALGAVMKGKLKFGIYLSRVAQDSVRISVGDRVTFV